MAHRDFRGSSDLSQKAEADEMERPGWAFDFAILSVQSDPKSLEQRFSGSTPRAEPSGWTELELMSQLLSN